MTDIFQSLFSSTHIADLEPLQALDDILNSLESLGLTDDCIENFTDAAKAAYLKSKIDPTDNKEKVRLECKLAITYTEKQTNQLHLNALSKSEQDLSKTLIGESKFISRKSKLQDYIKELSEQYDELKQLKQEEKEILERFVYHNFQAERPKRGYFESDQAYANRVISSETQLRKEFVQKNSEKILLETLKSRIIKEMPSFSKEATLLQKEDYAQGVLTPFYNQKIAERKQEIEKIKTERENNRYYAQTTIYPKKHITNDAPDLNISVGKHYGFKLLKKELKKVPQPEIISSITKEERRVLIETNQERSNMASLLNKNITERRVSEGNAKAFKKLV